MRKPPTIDARTTTLVTSPTGTLTVLSVSPLEEHHVSLQAMVGHSAWTLFKAHDVASAVASLQQHEIAVVLCEQDLLPGSWIELLEYINALRNAPSLIVTSRLADEHLWAEALNLGAWDVLAQPFDAEEVTRILSSAWQHWRNDLHSARTEPRATSTAA